MLHTLTYYCTYIKWLDNQADVLLEAQCHIYIKFKEHNKYYNFTKRKM